MANSGVGYEILGAVKIKDGVFIGDELAAQDLEFVVANKVTHVINCCGRNVPNHWESIGVVYLTYYWVDNENQIILDNKDVVANECFHFLEEALSNAESILIHSVRGQSRSCVVLAAYMMRKYSWGLRKTMEFLSSRRPDINLKPAFVQQLSCYERRLIANSKTRNFTTDWLDVPSMSVLDGDELLLRNTFMNSQIENLTVGHALPPKASNRPPLTWSDAGADDKAKLEKSSDKPHCKTGANGQIVLKSIIKTSRENQTQAQTNTRNTASMASRPTTASSSEDTAQQQPDSWRQKVGGQMELPTNSASSSYNSGDKPNNNMQPMNTSNAFGNMNSGNTVDNSNNENFSSSNNGFNSHSNVSSSHNAGSNHATPSHHNPASSLNANHSSSVGSSNAHSNAHSSNAHNNSNHPSSGNNNMHVSPRSSKYFTSNTMLQNNQLTGSSGMGSQNMGGPQQPLSSHQPIQHSGHPPGYQSSHQPQSSHQAHQSGHQHVSHNQGQSSHHQGQSSHHQPSHGHQGHQQVGNTYMGNQNQQQHGIGMNSNFQQGNGMGVMLPPNPMRRRPSDSREEDQHNYPSDQRRHSIGGSKREESPMLLPFRNRTMDKEPPNNLRRREASPKLDRHGQARGDSPMRVANGRSDLRSVSNHGNRASSHDGRLNGSPHRAPQPVYDKAAYDKASYDKVQQNSSLGGLLGSLRPGAVPKQRMSGMNAFRNSGPVKAHRSAAPEVFENQLRKSTRPATAPSTRVLTTTQQYGSRPNSPLLQRGSRPGSPVCGRPPSPSRGANGALQSSVNQALGLNFRTKSLSSHMRRAPSPTPAFNRAPSPSRPRWRM